MTLKEFDVKYIDSLKSTFFKLEEVHSDVLKDYKFDLNENQISDAILERLKTYYVTQNHIKIFLGKHYVTAAADFFVETTLFYLNLYLESQKSGLKAFSEKKIKAARNSIRPDISVWRDDEVIAIIECKTQLGWNRNNWEQDYNSRESILKVDFPNAKSFLLVMTGENWGGFGEHHYLNSNFFCLLKNTWPFSYTGSEQIFTPIENLFKQLK
jgi:hypothetical protein